MISLTGCSSPRLVAELPTLQHDGATSWDQALEVTSDNYRIVTNSNSENALLMAGLMEILYATCSRLFGPGQKHERLTVYAFARRAQYEQQTAALQLSAGHLSGIYAPGRSTGIYLPLVASNGTHPFFTLVHEGLHQYLHEVHGLPIAGTSAKLPSVPLWLSEGLALYMEAALVEPAALAPGRRHPERLQHLQSLVRRGRMPGISQVVSTSYGEPFSNADYSVAWGLVQTIHSQGLWPDYWANWQAVVRSEAMRFLNEGNASERNLLQSQQDWARRLSRLSLANFKMQLFDPGQDWTGWQKAWQDEILELTSRQ